MQFTGLSAFPLTPLADDSVDLDAFRRIVARIAASGVDSVTALGSTGSYAYLDRAERADVVRAAVAEAGDVPVYAGIGALRTKHVVEHAADAQEAGAQGLLLAPVSYQPLTDDEVFALFHDVSRSTDLPLVVYDNPRTTRFEFSLDLYGRIAELPNVASIKIPGVPTDPWAARAHVGRIRGVLPSQVTIGVSGDAFAAPGLQAGCDAWYSVIAGTIPAPAVRIVESARQDDFEAARAESDRLQPLWDLFAEVGGGIRVMAAIAEQASWARPDSLPRPVQGLDDDQRARLARVTEELALI
ncbi:dihydrodipicolinate synthase family protein [Microbacterium indicum]|uniref:dihydrodipicolinate synthase family protein n=1 Tax=Microbacterium indicum TaxID=358100 RepID=UPI000428F228|nr:dihydrodipicolinate synthase family protein [Microbacterium indicum]